MLSMQEDNNEIDCNIHCYTVTLLTGLQMKVSKLNKKYVIYFSTEIYVVGTQKNRLVKTVLLITPKQMFKLMDRKMITF